MPATYEPLATTTLSSAQSFVTFSNISGSYTDLVIVAQAKTVSVNGADIYVRFNGDTAGNYSIHVMSGNGSTAESARYNSTIWGALDFNGVVKTADGHNAIAHIMNYSNTTTFKTFLSRSNNANSGVDANICTWRSTSAITSVTLTTNNADLAIGSIFSLYGIKAA